eukprot:10201513-Heterocapsa_arctica.AAC.1
MRRWTWSSPASRSTTARRLGVSRSCPERQGPRRGRGRAQRDFPSPGPEGVGGCGLLMDGMPGDCHGVRRRHRPEACGHPGFGA